MDNNENKYVHNKAAEEALLGSILLNPDCFEQVYQLISPEHFYIIRNGWVYHAYENLRNANIPIDIITLSEELENNNILADIGGQSYLLELVTNTPTSLHVMEYAKLVLAASLVRKGGK